jgi:hypothetical protein
MTTLSATARVAFLGAATMALSAIAGCDPPPPGRTRPFGCEIYLRGTFLDDDPDAAFTICDGRNRLEYRGGTRYTCSLLLPAGSHRFKVADASWKAVNLGACRFGVVLAPGTAYGACSGEGSNDFLIEVPEQARYTFEIHATNRARPLIRWARAL